VVIGPGSAADAQSLVKRFDLPFPVLADPDQVAYRSLGLERVWLGLMLQHGTILLDRSGRIRYTQTGPTPNHAYNEPGLLEALRSLDRVG